MRLVQCNLGFNHSTRNIGNYQRCIIAISSKNYIITDYDDKFNYKNVYGSNKFNNYDILREMRCIPILYSYYDVIGNDNNNHSMLYHGSNYNEKRIMFDDCSSFILSSTDTDKTIMSRFIVIDTFSNTITTNKW